MIKQIIVFSFLALLQVGCRQADDRILSASPKGVHLVYDQGRHYLVKNGKRVFVKGALGHSHLRDLKEIGGNTINVYHEYLTRQLFDEADSLGLYVAVTLNLARPAQGANYSDTLFIKKQRHLVDSIVNTYKEEPALLFWIIGNEMHLGLEWAGDVWQEINTLSKRVHALDPDHLTTTNIAAFDRKHLFQVKYYCGDIDFLSFNAHHRNYVLQRELRNILWGWDGAYLITEWTGPVYWHEMQKTSWGAPAEPSSSEKAKMMAHNYHIAIERDSSKCLGGFVFYWGEKQERTHTMFSLILEDRYKTQAFEVLQYFWLGGNPENYSPRIETFKFDKEENPLALQLRRGSVYDLIIKTNDPDGDSLWTKIEVYKEGDYKDIFGGDFEIKPEQVFTESYRGAPDRIAFTTPENEGPFRVFLYVYDQENVATANIPFYVLPF
jgi:hypothetical protein